MSEELRLYFFECGSLKTQVQFIKMNQGLGDPYEIPVPFYLITHPNGNVLYDGGNALEVAQDARGHWDGRRGGLRTGDGRGRFRRQPV